jgi:hypothetical protein
MSLKPTAEGASEPPPFSFVSWSDFSFENALVNLLVSDANISVME